MTGVSWGAPVVTYHPPGMGVPGRMLYALANSRGLSLLKLASACALETKTTFWTPGRCRSLTRTAFSCCGVAPTAQPGPGRTDVQKNTRTCNCRSRLLLHESTHVPSAMNRPS